MGLDVAALPTGRNNPKYSGKQWMQNSLPAHSLSPGASGTLCSQRAAPGPGLAARGVFAVPPRGQLSPGPPAEQLRGCHRSDGAGRKRGAAPVSAWPRGRIPGPRVAPRARGLQPRRGHGTGGGHTCGQRTETGALRRERRVARLRGRWWHCRSARVMQTGWGHDGGPERGDRDLGRGAERCTRCAGRCELYSSRGVRAPELGETSTGCSRK